MATAKTSTATAKPRKPRSNDRRNALKTIRENAKTVLSEKLPGQKYLGFIFSFSETGQGIVFVYSAHPDKPEAVSITKFTSPIMLNAARAAEK